MIMPEETFNRSVALNAFATDREGACSDRRGSLSIAQSRSMPLPRSHGTKATDIDNLLSIAQSRSMPLPPSSYLMRSRETFIFQSLSRAQCLCHVSQQQ